MTAIKSIDLSTWRHRDLRLLCFNGVLSGLGFRGEIVVLGWLLLKATGSPLMVGLGFGIRMSPNLLLGLMGGVIADRADRTLVAQCDEGR